jgi:hypothetical protein
MRLFALQHDSAFGGVIEPEDHAAEGRFAATRFANQTESFALADIERYSPDGAENILSPAARTPHFEILAKIVNAQRHESLDSFVRGGCDGLFDHGAFAARPFRLSSSA